MGIEMETRTLKIALVPVGEAIFDERTITVEIDDEAGGEFVVIRQTQDSEEFKFAINPEEWPALCEMIDRMIKECR